MGPLEKSLVECINLEKLSKIVIEDVAVAALKKVVDDSTNKFDDAAFAMLEPLLIPQLELILNAKIAEIKA
jgi:pantoate kinase